MHRRAGVLLVGPPEHTGFENTDFKVSRWIMTPPSHIAVPTAQSSIERPFNRVVAFRKLVFALLLLVASSIS